MHNGPKVRGSVFDQGGQRNGPIGPTMRELEPERQAQDARDHQNSRKYSKLEGYGDFEWAMATFS